MSIPAGYTQSPSGFFYKSSDGSGPYSVDSTGAIYFVGSSMSNYGHIRTTDEPSAIFNDTFETLDTTNRWTTKTSTGTATVTAGSLTVASSTTASAYGGLSTQPTFTPKGLNFIVGGLGIIVPTVVIANSVRCVGFGNFPGTPTTTVPVTDGVCFLLDGTGVLYGKVYSAGVETGSTILNYTPVSGVPFGAAIQYRGDGAVFLINSPNNIVGQLPGITPSVEALSFFAISIAGSTPPGVSATMQCFGCGVGDTGKNGQTIVDGTFPFRQATVLKASTAAATTDTALVVALHPSSPLAGGTSATSLGKAEDAVAASGDTGVFVLGVRRDTLASSTNATGDYNEIAVGPYGEAIVRRYETHAKTYSCAVNVAAAASATDIAVISGSASTTVFITKVIISGIQTTAGLNDVLLIKRSTADTGGTSTGGTIIPHDSSDAAAGASVLAYTANPGALGTTVGSVRRNYLPVAGATSVVNPVVTYEFGVIGRPIVLRGVAQQLAVNLNGATLTGGTFDINFEWFEI